MYALKVIKQRHISSRIFGVTHCYHQQKRNSHRTHTSYNGHSFNQSPCYGIHQTKLLDTSVQFTYLPNFHVPICIISFHHKRFAHSQHPEEKCEPKKKSKKGFYIAGTVLLVAGVLGYAKHDPDFRSYLDKNIPGSDDFIAMIFQEKKTYLQLISETLDKIKDKIVDNLNYALGGGESSSTTSDEKSSKSLPPCDDKQKPYKPPRSAFKPLLSEDSKQDSKFAERRALEAPKDDQVKITPVDPPPKSPAEAPVDDASETHPKSLVELEESIGSAAQIAIKHYNDAICVLIGHAEEVYKLVEQSVEKVDPKIWPQIKAKSDKKEELVAEAEMNASIAEKSIEKLRRSIDHPKLDAPPEVKARAKKNMQKVLKDVDDARKAFEKQRSKVSVTEKYWSKVQQAREHFSEELEILFPNVRLSEKQLKLAEGEIDLFILYAFQNILFYQKELSKLETVGELRVKEALEKSRAGDPMVKTAVEQELDKEKRILQEEYQKRTLALKSECENEIKKQLRRQTEAHNDHLQEAMALKEKEVERKLQREIEERILEERTKYKEELAGMVARLKGVDEAIKKRGDQDKYAQQSQLLWSACQTLVSALKNSDFSKPWSEQLKPLKDEVKAISKAAEKDDFVTVIVNSIPNEALDRGVYSEDALRERFLNVERVASVVAIVPECGASLPLILLSYLQNLIMIKYPLPIPAFELANQPFDPSSLSTFDILQRARFWMDRGDIAQALKYMNLLQGGARAVSTDWIKEAQLLLETQQAANVLLTHASASGLVYS